MLLSAERKSRALTFIKTPLMSDQEETIKQKDRQMEKQVDRW